MIDALLTLMHTRAQGGWDEYIQSHLSHCEPDEVAAARARQQALYEEGLRLEDEGYILHMSPRQMRGLHFAVPSEAVEWDLMPGGYVAGAEQERLLWVTWGERVRGH